MPLRARGGKVSFDVSAPNSPKNVTVRDVLGNKNDDEVGNSLYARAYISEQHIHRVQKVYPTLADSIQLTGGAGAWELGNLTELMPANTAESNFDIHWISLCSASVNDEYELILYANTTQIGRAPFTITDKKDVTDGVPFQCPILDPGVRIRGRLASKSGGDTANFRLLYHEY